MKYEEYFSLIRRLEEESESSPAKYRFKVLLLAICGYAYFGIVLAAPLLAIALAVIVILLKPGFAFIILNLFGKLAWLVGIVAVGAMSAFWGAAKAVFVSPEKPHGHEAGRADAPGLFELVEETSRKLEARKPDAILLTADFNASVVSIPKWGPFGAKTYLSLGIPLMKSLTPEQFKAVLAHETGHISGKHGKGTAWIYQLRDAWGRFLETQEINGNRSLTFLYEGFVNKFFPYFNAYSFVLARRQEKEADLMAVELTGAAPLAESLIQTGLKGAYLEQSFWKGVFDGSKEKNSPPERVFGELYESLKKKADRAEESLNLHKLLSARTDYHDTHPCLSERLAMIGYNAGEAKLPDAPPEGLSAADIFLPGLADSLTGKFDEEWHAAVAETWKNNYQYFQDVKKRYDELSAKANDPGLSDEELFEYGSLVATQNENKAAIPILEELAARNPKNADAKYTLGAIYLESDDPKGVKLLEDAMAADPMLSGRACEAIYAFHFRSGNDKEATDYLRRAEGFQESLEAAQRERGFLSDYDEIAPHEAPAEKLAEISRKLAFHDEIISAYIVRKEVVNFPEQPFCVLALEVKIKWFGNGGVKENDVLDAVANSLNSEGVHYVVLLSKFKKLH